jgi:hypothetical protein
MQHTQSTAILFENLFSILKINCLPLLNKQTKNKTKNKS